MNSFIFLIGIFLFGGAFAQNCNKADVAFLLDESSSIQPIPFDEIKQFVFDVMDGLNLADNQSHVSIVMFSDNAQLLFRFDIIKSTPLREVKKMLRQRPQYGGSTHTYKGLDIMRRAVFTPSYGARGTNDVARVCIVITDGNSQLPNRTKEAAQQLHEANVHVFAIGVGNETEIRQSELENIASDTKSVFRVKDTSGLNAIKNSISGAACTVQKEEEEEWVPTEGPEDEWVPTEGPEEEWVPTEGPEDEWVPTEGPEDIIEEEK